MENSLKQRIIGAIVLAALAIIFLPAILKEKASNGPFNSQIPEQPKALKEYKIDKKKIDELVADKDKIKNQLNKRVKEAEASSLANKTSSGSSSDNTSADVKLSGEPLNPDTLTGTNSVKRKSKGAESKNQEKHEKTRVTTSVKKAASPNKNFTDSPWVVQVASFAKQTNAISLVKKLKTNHFKAYRRKVKSGGKTVYRVYVGPYIQKKDASKAVAKVSKVSETSAVIRPFDPISH